MVEGCSVLVELVEKMLHVVLAMVLMYMCRNNVLIVSLSVLRLSTFFFLSLAGCQVVKTYCGHGIGELFHTLPTVPHYPKNKAKGVMKPGHVFTIEPMINVGTWQASCLEAWGVSYRTRRRGRACRGKVVVVAAAAAAAVVLWAAALHRLLPRVREMRIEWKRSDVG